MPFEYGYRLDDETGKHTLGLVENSIPHIIVRTIDDRSDVIIIKMVDDERADIHIIDDEPTHNVHGYREDNIDKTNQRGSVGPDNPLWLPFESELGDKGILYVMYRQVGGRLFYLAGGERTIIEEHQLFPGR